MKKQLLFLVFLQYLLIWGGFEFFLIHAREPSVFPSSSTPASSPLSSPVSSSMAAFSPGVIEDIEEPKVNPKKKMVVAVIAASAFALVGVLILSLLLMWMWMYHHKRASDKPQNYRDNKNSGILQSRLKKGGFNSFKAAACTRRERCVSAIDFKLLKSATGNFEESNVVGIGGFGRVYKARLDDNRYVAVKKVDGGGQDAEREFENEVDLLGKIHHPNIIALLGYCTHGESRFLIYELMEKGSLENQLHGPSRGSALTWDIRMKIALDVARGLEFLHEHCNPPVIHRDLKSSNILLDSDFNSKLSDFGLAVAADGLHNKNNIKLSGTLGYVAPEYLLDGKLTDKSDVYAFGVVLLELLLGRKPVEKLSPSHCQSIVTWAMPQLTDRLKLPNIVDPAIRDTMDLVWILHRFGLALLNVPAYDLVSCVS